MAPDLNSLPSSRPPSMPSSPNQQRSRWISDSSAEPLRTGPSSPRSPSLSSLQAAALINAGLQHSPSNASPARGQGLERRRSSLLSINDPTVPAPGEMQQSNGSNASSPRLGRRSFVVPTADRHHRQPSLGELHQELESEQEAQVNRLLHMIRIQQDQLAATQRPQQTPQDASLTSTDYAGILTPATTASASSQLPPFPIEHSSPGSMPSAHSLQGHFNRPHSLSRQSSSARQSAAGNAHSRGSSPALRPVSGNLRPLAEDFLLGGTRDECAFYQAETQTLTRENQMLKLRIRELERQISDMSSPSSSQHGPGSAGGMAYSPAQNSPLTGLPVAFDNGSTHAATVANDADAKVD